MSPKIILASASPRRSSILSENGFKFEVYKSQFQETKTGNPELILKKNCLGKLEDVSKKFPKAIIISGDTFPYFKGSIYSKPGDEKEAGKFLRDFSSNSQEVFSGFALSFEGKTIFNFVVSEVFFREISDSEIANYLKTNEWRGRSGGYACRGEAGKFIEKIKGSVAAVEGFPIEIFLETWKKFILK